MTTEINILSIIGKHSPLLAAAIKHNMPTEVTPKRVKEAIKEIVETVIDKCAEKAEAIEGWNTGFTGSAASVDKDSILNVKNLINYD